MIAIQRTWTREKGTHRRKVWRPDKPRLRCVCGNPKEDTSKRYCNHCAEKRKK